MRCHSATCGMASRTQFFSLSRARRHVVKPLFELDGRRDDMDDAGEGECRLRPRRVCAKQLAASVLGRLQHARLHGRVRLLHLHRCPQRRRLQRGRRLPEGARGQAGSGGRLPEPVRKHGRLCERDNAVTTPAR
jgi:hypothetical protein